METSIRSPSSACVSAAPPSSLWPEVLFDHDFPGHYCRRIKTVSVSVPTIIGPYTGVNCTLRLLEHRYRLRPGGAAAGASADSSSSSSYYLADSTVGDGDVRFHIDRVPIAAVALSTGNQDSGAFELNFSTGERYVPFEGAGVISRWKLEFPAPYPQFDYRSISDVLFTVRYTALDGSALWQKEATDAVRKFRSEVGGGGGSSGGGGSDKDQGQGAYILVDLPVDLADEWHCFKIQLVAAGPDSDKPVSMDLSRLPNLLPFWSPRHATSVAGVSVAIQPAKGAVKVLGRVLAEQETSGDKLRLLGMPDTATGESEDGDDSDASSGEGLKRIDEVDLSLSVVPQRLKGKPPQNFWVVVHFTRAE
ncbi:Tc toxin complex TcA C-terminal TcB-binding domain-containing protein [Microdochium nivale]|nr:Tc toxin complex TcA C-terminal TcB-binding domain-containing protein [Microdochium nivale]